MRMIRGVVLDVDPVAQVVSGTTAPFPDEPGAPFKANYYEGTPAVGDPVVIGNMDEGSNSWVVLAGTTSTGGIFGVGGDGALTFTRNTAAPAARTTSADASASSQSTTVNSPSGNFTNADLQAVVSGAGIPTGAQITKINSSTSIEISHPIWQSGGIASVALTITPAIPWTKSGAGASTTFTLQRNLYCTTLSLLADDGSFLLCTNGFAIFCNELLYVADGVVVHNDGAAASGASAGAGAPSGIYGGGGNGGAGKASGTSGAGTVGSSMTGSIATLSAGAVISGGGGGGSSTGGLASQFSAPATVVNAFANGMPGAMPQAVTLELAHSSTRFTGGAGGSGGSYAGGGGGTGGGGGGGGGGVVLIAARQLQNFGTIRSNGGAGAAGQATGAVASGAGGGGGGGGGAVVLIYSPARTNLGAVYAVGGASGGGSSSGSSGGVGIQQWVYYVDYSLGYPQARRKLVTVTSGGGGGAGSSVAGGVSTAGQAGQAGLVWAIPI